MATLHMLGTSAGLINPERNPSAYLLETATGDILLDCGEGVSRTLAQRDYDWSRLTTIVITHTHADHAGGFPLLIQQLYLSKRTTPLAVYAPEEYASRIGDLLCMHYMFPEVFSFELSVHALRLGEAVVSNQVRLTPHPTGHLEKAQAHVAEHGYPNRCVAFALTIETGGATLLYSGDLGAFADVSGVLSNCDVAILDSTHIDLGEVRAWAKENPGTQLYLSHIAPGFDTSAFDDSVVSGQVRRIHVAEDGMNLTL